MTDYPTLAQWRVHIVPKLQPRDQTFVLMPRGDQVVIDWYGKDMAGAKWLLQLKYGPSFQPPGPPSGDSYFLLVHERTQKRLGWPDQGYVDHRWDYGIREFGHGLFGDPNDAWGKVVMKPGPLTLHDLTSPNIEGDAVRFDSLDSPYLAINDLSKQRVLDLPGGRTDSGTQVLAFAWNGGDNQKWKLEFVN
jgi:hypothetical protein